jgi:hypothetical protein
MEMLGLSMKRSLATYGAVQGAIAAVIRNRRFQLRGNRIRILSYLQLGCGPNCPTTFINADYDWRPDVDLCRDLKHGLPFRSGSFSGIFTEHCVEHLSLFS